MRGCFAKKKWTNKKRSLNKNKVNWAKTDRFSRQSIFFFIFFV